MTTATKKRPKTAGEVTAAQTGVIPFERDRLKAVLGLLGRVVPTRGPKPVLANVHFRDRVAVATDLEVRVELPVVADGQVDVLLPHGRLAAIVRECDSDTVGLRPDEKSVTVTAGRGTWTLPTERVAEFPTWEVTAKPFARLPADELERMLSAVSYATDDESSRFALGGVLLELTDGELVAVATDGRRLSIARADIDQATDDGTAIVPLHAVQVLRAVLAAAESGSGVQLSVSPRELVAELDDGSRLVARLLEGRFPKWRDVVPAAGDQTPRAAADHGELLSAVRQAAIVTTEQSKGVVFQFMDDELELSGRSAESGESRVSCPLRQGGPITRVSLDPRFVSDALLAVDPDEPVEILATKPGERVVFFSGSVTAVVMPLAEE